MHHRADFPRSGSAFETTVYNDSPPHSITTAHPMAAAMIRTPNGGGHDTQTYDDVAWRLPVYDGGHETSEPARGR